MARKKKKEQPLNLAVVSKDYWTPPSRQSLYWFIFSNIFVFACAFLIALIIDKGADRGAIKLAYSFLGILAITLFFNYVWVWRHCKEFYRYFYRQVSFGLIFMFALLIPVNIPNVAGHPDISDIRISIPIFYDHKFPIPTDKEIDLLTRVVWGEARSEKPQYQSAIVHTIINRAEHPKKRYGATFSFILTYPKAYSCMNPDDPNYPKLLSLSKDSPEYKKIREVVLNTIHSRMNGGIDPTDGATHYHTKDVNPKWNMAASSMFTLGSHKFWVGVDENDPDRKK